MSCLITTGYNVDCTNAVGGIAEVFIANYQDLTNDAGSTVASNVFSVFPATTVYAYQFRPENGGLDISINTDPSTGVTFHEQVLTLRFNGVDQTALDTFTQLAYARTNIWALDRNGTLFVLGATYGCNVTDLRSSVGRMFSDGVGFDITFTAKEDVTRTYVPVAGANYPFADAATSGITIG